MNFDSSSSQQPTVYLVEDDQNDAEVIQRVCESIGLPIRCYESPHEVLEELSPTAQGCIVVDLMMPEMSGLQLHESLQAAGSVLPIIVVTGHADAKTCREAFQLGVFDFVEKSANYHDLMVVIRKAMQLNREQLRLHQHQRSFDKDLASLSPREREVMTLLANGKSQKEIAELLDISVQTASKHRSKVLEKLCVNNEIDMLKRMWSIDPNEDSSTAA